jgi:hypothetical protein
MVSISPEDSMDTAEEVEEERLRSLAERDAEEPGWRERYVPGTCGCHEALHVSSTFADNVGGRLLDHGAIIQNPEWYALANRAFQALADLYQAIGTVHLDINKDFA